MVTLVFAGAISRAAWLMYKDRPDDELNGQITSTYDPADYADFGVSAAEILSRLGLEYDGGVGAMRVPGPRIRRSRPRTGYRGHRHCGHVRWLRRGPAAFENPSVSHP
ncbi:hypothetical protein [Nocardia sp. R7R-8]|uniref:hypothetical protein n=1 Tax=Nocardia sp. R7R-8 TaxID=3459304 RepID=UPI00403DEBEC